MVEISDTSNLGDLRPTKRARTSTPPTTNAPKRGPGFSETDTTTMLSVAEMRLPISMEDWEDTAREYNAHPGVTPRTAESLRRKFNKIARLPAPTGGTRPRTTINKAKEIRAKMVEESHIAAGDDADEFAETLFDEAEADARAEEEDVSDGEFAAQGLAPSPETSAPSSRPLGRTRSRGRSQDGSGFEELIRFSIMQAQQERAERAEDRRRLQEEREEDRRRHDRMMEMMLAVLSANRSVQQ